MQAAHLVELGRTLAKLGFAFGLKNDVDQARQPNGTQDVAVNEECFRCNACGSLPSFIKANKPVFNPEY
jgi:hypothetical protein